MENKILRRTSDGSHTVFSKRFQATYHSEHGALRESLHVFIKHGLFFVFDRTDKDQTVNILECGFGTGLNAWLTAIESLKRGRSVRYIGAEPHPLPKEFLERINYPSMYMDGKYKSLWDELHERSTDDHSLLYDRFGFEVHMDTIQKITPHLPIDLIYHDAFGPRVQKELWDRPLMKQYWTYLKDGGVLVTFGAQGAFKRHLKDIGFEVEAIPGPPGKREMTRAIKSSV